MYGSPINIKYSRGVELVSFGSVGRFCLDVSALDSDKLSYHFVICHRVPAPKSGAPIGGFASDPAALFSILALAHNRYGDQGMGVGSPQASCKV